MTTGTCKRCKTQGELLEVFRPAGWEPSAGTLRGLFCGPCVKAWAEWDRDPAPRRQGRRPATPEVLEMRRRSLAKARAARTGAPVNGRADSDCQDGTKTLTAPTAQRGSK